MLTKIPFYFSSIRNLVAAFGTLFNNIHIYRRNSDTTGLIEKKIKVPIAYSAADKSIIMIQQRATQRQENKIDLKTILPRIGFEVNSLAYDPSRKLQTTLKRNFNSLSFGFYNTSVTGASGATGFVNIYNSLIYKTPSGTPFTYSNSTGSTSPVGELTPGNTYYSYFVDDSHIQLASSWSDVTDSPATSIISLDDFVTTSNSVLHTLTTPNITQYVPIPYNVDFSLYIFVKNIDDGLQIMEQILPYFTPFYTVSVKDILGTSKDVPINLTGVSFSDMYEGAVEEDRVLKWTLTFTAATWIYPPLSIYNNGGGLGYGGNSLIKRVVVDFFKLTADDNTITGDEQVLETMVVEVNPLTANVDEAYTITTSFIEGATAFW